MSVILKKNVSTLSKRDIDKEIHKIEEFEQDIEGSICQCVFIEPVMVDPCLHLYGDACIKSWSSRHNECPKGKEEINGYSKQPNMEEMLEFYQKLCTQQKDKLLKIKQLVQEREEMQSKINTILDQNAEPPKEPPKEPEISIPAGSTLPIPSTGSIVEEEEKDFYQCRLGMRRPLHQKFEDVKNIAFSPISLNGNIHQQTMLQTYGASNGLTLDNIYQYVLEDLQSISSRMIHPDSQTEILKPSYFACNECMYEFTENGLYYYCVKNKFLIDGSSNPDCEMGFYCPSQTDESHAKSFNHFIAKM